MGCWIIEKQAVKWKYIMAAIFFFLFCLYNCGDTFNFIIKSANCDGTWNLKIQFSVELELYF